VIEESFSKGNSPIHNLDPRLKIVYALLFSIIVAISTRPLVSIVALLFSIILIAIARLNIKILLKRLLIVNSFILLMWIILPATFPGKTIFSLGFFKPSYEGARYMLLLTIRCNAIILAGIGLISTCGVFNLTHALRHLGIPDKLVHLFFLIYRYSFVIESEYNKIGYALKARGFKPKTSFHTYQTYSFVVGSILLRGFDHSEQIHKAMCCRGFKGKYWILDHFKLRKIDTITLFIISLSIILLALLQWTKIISS